jgi:hypothetical protein
MVTAFLLAVQVAEGKKRELNKSSFFSINNFLFNTVQYSLVEGSPHTHFYS